MSWSGLTSLHVLVELDVAGGDGAFLVHRQHEHLLIARMGLELDFLQVQHDVGDILDHAFDGGEFVHGAIDLRRR